MAPIKSNNPLAAYFDFFSKTGLDAVNQYVAPQGLTATGGIISDYEDSGTYYRAHVFTSSGTFKVDDLGSIGTTVEYVVVAGGGGGGNRNGGGGGAGGYRSSVSGESTGGGGSLETALTVSAGPTTYTVTIGSGGLGGEIKLLNSVTLKNGTGLGGNDDVAFIAIEAYRNDDLDKGEIRQVDWEVEGADVTVTRTVLRNGDIINEDIFRTHYRPWRSVFEYGPGTKDIPPDDQEG